MIVQIWMRDVGIAQLLVCTTILLTLWRRGLLREFGYLSAFVAVEIATAAVSIPILFFRAHTGLSVTRAYAIYFYSHWGFFALQSVLVVAVLFNVFHLAMAPLKGLHELGKVVFRWISIVSVAFACCVVLGPLFFLPGNSADAAVFAISSRVLQGTSVLTLCLLVFVCFAIRPLGLTFRSRIFGVSLGLGVYSMVQLIEAAWSSIVPIQSVYAPVYLFTAVGGLVAYSIWATYFIMPEPARGMIMLPTTSPYFFWNKISEILGDAPGNVVIAGFTPDMMAPGELRVAHAMSRAASSGRPFAPVQHRVSDLGDFAGTPSAATFYRRTAPAYGTSASAEELETAGVS